MTKWLRKIAAMMQEIPKSFKFSLSNIAEKEGGEEEKGKLSQETTDLFKLLNWLQEMGEKIGKEHRKVCSSCDENECEEFRRRILTLRGDIDTVKEIFFSSVRDELKLNPHDYPNIGIRKNGIIVVVPSRKNDGIDVTIISKMPSGLMTLVESIRKMEEQRRGKSLDS